MAELEIAAKDVLVVGAGGQLGLCLQTIRPDLLYVGRDKMDLADKNSITSYVKNIKPKLIINVAAYTQVDKAEEEKELAEAINAEASELLAKSCERYLMVSTDYVFDGKASSPISEDAPTAPINYYGQTKLDGEKLAIRANSNTWIIRTSWLFSEFGKNFVKTILRMASEKPELRVVSDQTGSPTSAMDLARVIDQFIKGPQIPYGIYNFANSGTTTWHGFATEIVRKSGSNVPVIGIASKEFPTLAKRPSYSVLSTKKISKYVGAPRPWQEALADCLSRLL